MKPPGLLRIRPDRVAEICSWCEAEQEKKTGQVRPVTSYYEECGYETSHGICEHHKAEMLKDLPFRPSDKMETAGLPSQPQQSGNHDERESNSNEAENGLHKMTDSERETFIQKLDAWRLRNQAEGKRQV